MTTSTKTRVSAWIGWILVAGLLAVLALVAIGPLKPLMNLASIGTTTETRDTQVIESVTTEEQVVLLSLGIQGLMEENSSGEVFGVAIPGSSRTSFIQYAFTAKLGIEGGEVTIEPTGEDSYLITIPAFIFVGHDDQTFELVAEDNGALSWVTPEIDSVEMVNKILDDTAQAEYIASNAETLQEQAASFYRGIVTGIDPELTVEFAYAG